MANFMKHLKFPEPLKYLAEGIAVTMAAYYLTNKKPT